MKLAAQTKFFIYLIERYAESRGLSARDALDMWDSLGITNDVYDLYDLYHVEALENAFDDIDRRVARAREASYA